MACTRKSKPEITSVVVTPNTFYETAEVGSVVGHIQVKVKGGPWKDGTLTVSDERFTVSGDDLILAEEVVAGTYPITITATMDAASNSPYSQVETITCLAATTEPPVPGDNPDNTMTLLSDENIVNHPLQFGRAFVQGEIPNYPEVLLNGQPLLTQADVKNRWPDNSVKFAVLSVVVPNLIATVEDTLTFRNQPTGNNSVADPPAIDAEIRITSGAETRTASVQAMLDRGDFRSWASGPVAQTIVCYDRSPSRVHDIGWTTHRALHPWFIVTFWPTIDRVWVRYVGEICNTEAMQAQAYDLELLLSGVVVFSQSGIQHKPATRWTRTIEEQQVHINHNVAYLAATGLVANYDPSVVVSDALSAKNYEGWLTSNRQIGGVGWWQNYMPSTGARKDIGLAPAWAVQALMSGDWRDLKITLGQADLAGWWNRHTREGDPAKAQFGRTATCYGRPTWWYMDSRYTPAPQDAVTIIDVGPANGWLADEAHQPSPFTIPYLLTGDFYYLDSLELWAGANSLSSSPATQTQGRGGGHCTVWGGGQVRGMAWTYRTLFDAAALMPDSDPLKAEFEMMVHEAIAKDEGMRGLTGAPSANPAHPFHERYVYGSQWLGTTGDGWIGHGPNHACRWWGGYGGYTATDPVYYNTDVCYAAGPHWMTVFVVLGLARGRELGYPTDALLEWLAPHVVGQLATPGLPPQLASQYVIPAVMKVPGGNDWFPDWESVLSGWSAQKQTGMLNGAIEFVYWPLPVNYFAYIHAASAMLSYMPEGATARQNSENLIAAKEAETGKTIDWASDPTWAIVPRT